MSPVARTTAPDDALVDDTARAVAAPRKKAADSFVLHAPLELLARAALLPSVEPAARDAARERLVCLGDAYTAWGEEADEPPSRDADVNDVGAALAALGCALERGELDDADAAAAWLARHLDADELRQALADPVLPLLSAAAHGSIFLYHLPRVTPRSRDASMTLRPLVRELARYPGWDLSWYRGLPEPSHGRLPDLAPELARRLVRPPSPGDPGSDFIYPMMSLSERSGLAHEALHDIVRGISLADARRVLLRTAALSMLQDDPTHAPYGWSHCLTMPQAALGVAGACREPWHAVAVAATYVLSFRAIHGHVALDLMWEPDRPGADDAIGGLDADPDHAASAAWHAEPAQRQAIRARLASRAAAHEDAHLVKYTLACFDAAHADPDAEPLFLAAAAYLSAWWRQADAST